MPRKSRRRCRPPFGSHLSLEHLEARLALSLSTVASFDGFNGTDPSSPMDLVIDDNGNLYGITAGQSGGSTVFEVANGSSAIVGLTQFVQSHTPGRDLVVDKSGDLFGTVHVVNPDGGGSSSIFKLAHGSRAIATVATPDDPESLTGALTMDTQGNLYGMTAKIGSGLDAGRIFEIVNATGPLTTLATFPPVGPLTGWEIEQPGDQMALDAKGNLYGTYDIFNVPGDSGGVFELAKGSRTITDIGPSDGLVSSIAPVTDGNAYVASTTPLFEGSTRTDAFVSELPTVDNQSLFLGDAGDVVLAVDGNGNLYGIETSDDATGDGTLFEVARSSWTITTLASFNGANGRSPTTLIEDGQGNLYGTTAEGGANGMGTIFKLPAPITWTGLGGNNLWSNPDNWQGGTVPSAGADLVFPVGSAQLSTEDDLGLSMNSVIVEGSYTISGKPLAVDNDVTVEPTASLTVANTLTVSGTLTVPPKSSLVVAGQRGYVQIAKGGYLNDYGTVTVQPAGLVAGNGTSDTTPIDWASMKSTLQPTSIPDAAWSAIYPNLAAQLGDTLGSYAQRLGQDSQYLASLGESATNDGQLFSFEIQQANGISPLQNLSTATDLTVQAPGPPLAISRAFSSTIIGRNQFGPFGYGWALGGGWGQALAVQPDQSVAIVDSDGSEQIFQPETGGNYLSQPGDYNVLRDAGNGIFTLTTPKGQVTQFVNGQVAFIEDANGNRIAAGYTDSLLTSLTASSGESITLSYNGAGLIAQVTSSTGQSTRYAYDAANQHLLSVTQFQSTGDHVGYTTRYTYDTGSNVQTAHALLSVTGPDGVERDFGYDPQGHLSETSLNSGSEATHYGYGVGGTVTTTDATGAATTYYFDNRALLAKEVDPLLHSTIFTHDSKGELTQTTNASGQTNSYLHGPHGNVIESTDPAGNTTSFSFGPLARMTSTSDADGNTTQFEYDSAGDLLATIYADGTVEQNAFNPIGELLQSTDGNGNVVKYQYSSAGQLLSKTYGDGTQTVFTYSPYGNLTSVTDSTGTTTLSYDNANRLIEILYPDQMFLKYEYNGAGRRVQMVDQTGYTVNYVYSSLGQLARLTDGNGNTIVSYSYGLSGLLSEEDKGNGTYTKYGYDAAGEVLSLVNYAPGGAVNSSFVYAYNDVGLCSTQTTIDGTWTYSYDANGQLTHAVFAPNAANPDHAAAQDQQFFYDPAGNRTKTIINGVTTTYTVNDRNEYTEVGTTLYGYDRNGNVISQTTPTGTTSYDYNVNNQLVGINARDDDSTYLYDAFGKLYQTSTNGAQTQYLVDHANGNVVGQFTSAGGTTAQYVYGNGLVSQLNGNGVPSYYDFDALGSTAGLTNSSGSYVDSYGYFPFGGDLTSSTTVANPFQFVGQWGALNLGSDESLMGLRAYSSGNGSFLSQDPLGRGGGQNDLFEYADNQPLGNVDPTGLMSINAGQLLTGIGQVVSGAVAVGAAVVAAGGTAGALAFPAGLLAVTGGYSVGSGIQNIIASTGASSFDGTGGILGDIGSLWGGEGKAVGEAADLAIGLLTFSNPAAGVGEILTDIGDAAVNGIPALTSIIQSAGELKNDGTMIVAPGANIKSDGTLINDGNIRSSSNSEIESSGTEINDGTTDNSGNYFNYGVDTNLLNATYINRGDYQNDGDYYNFGDDQNVEGGTDTNTGNYYNNGDNTNFGVDTNVGDWQNTGDYINEATYGGDGQMTDGGAPNDSITVGANGSMQITGNLTELAGGGLAIAGNVTVVSGASLNIVGSLTVEKGSTLTVNGDLGIAKNGTLDIAGSLILEPGSTYLPVGKITVEPGATLTVLVPSINVTTSTLKLGATPQGTAGGAQNFTLSGSSLTADIILTGPAGVELSDDGGQNYAATLDVSEASGTVAATTILARIAPDAPPGPFSELIAIDSNGANEQRVRVEGAAQDAPLSASGTSVAVNISQPFTGQVATFGDADSKGAVGDYTAIIEWGDGATTSGTVTTASGGGFAVIGSHTYTIAGTESVTVQIVDGGGAMATAHSTANVAEPALTASGLTIAATEGSTFSAPVAIFSDANAAANISDYDVTIVWGDGAITQGTVTAQAGGGYAVTGSHAYAEEGALSATVTISEVAASAVTANTTVNVADAPLTGASVSIATATTISGAVAMFSDPDISDTTSDYVASIDWGDGQSGAGTVVAGATAGQFSVTGNHSYGDGNPHTVTVTVAHGTDQPLLIESAEPGQPINELGNFGLVEDTYVIGAGTVTVSADNGVLKNGSAPGALTVTAGTVTGANGGTFVFNSDGSFTYTPPAQFPGFDYAQYTATDAQGDTASATVNVLSQSGGVVWKFYESVLNRDPDYAGLQHWINDFQSGGKTGDIAVGFFESPELLDQVIGGYYQQYLLRPADSDGLTYWKNVWGDNGGPEKIRSFFAESAEFYASAGGTPDAWINALYQRILARAPDAHGEQHWLDYYQQQVAAGVDPAAVRYNIALFFLTSPEGFGDDVTGWFNEYLQRAPTDSELQQYTDEMLAGSSDRQVEQEITNLPEYGQEPPAAPAGDAVRLPDYYAQTTAAQQAALATRDALFAKLGA